MNIIDGGNYDRVDHLSHAEDEDVATFHEGYNFGWIEGVFIRCTLSIFGVLMFLRLNWMFANAGVGGALGIIVWSVGVTTLTTISLSALSTNGMVKGGGVYYMVSRSLGAEFGGVVGLTLFIAQSAAVSLHLNGFGEAVAILEDGNYVFDKNGDKVFFGCIGLVFCLGAAFLGANFEVQSQKVLAVSMGLALCTFYLGCFLATNDSTIHSTPISGATFASNMQGHYAEGHSWLTVFGVFFPACTGISAGSSISGDLKDPGDAIPKGTFSAILLTTIIYVSMGLLMCAVFTPEGLAEIKTQISAIDISVVPQLMYLGMFAAALSSALALIVGAPRVLQAVARDEILPISFYKKSYFAQEEPLRGYITVVIVAFVCIVGLDLNTVSPIVTNFYLVQYGLMNWSVYHAHISKAPGWRPSYKYWSPYAALLGALMCFVSMFMVDWVLAVMTILASIALYEYIDYIKPDVNWGDSGVANCQKQAVEAIYRMERLKDHVKNYRPQFLLLCDDPKENIQMISLMNRLKKTRGLSIIGRVIIGDMHHKDTFVAAEKARKDVIMVNNQIIAILQVICAPTLLAGAESLFQLAGFGKLKPNTILIGFKTKWQHAKESSLVEYIEILRSGFATNHAVCVLRNYHNALKYVPYEAAVVENVGENLYSPEEERGHVDVWWLVEDGGVPFLMAFLMNRHADYRKTHSVLRLFGLVPSALPTHELEKERERLKSLLSRFRFDAEVILVSDDRIPSDEEIATYEEMSGEKDGNIPDTLTRTVINISHHMNVHSLHAHVIVVSLPAPKMNCPPKQYFAYLELLSSTPRPTFIVRGNQQTVLSYHS